MRGVRLAVLLEAVAEDEIDCCLHILRAAAEHQTFNGGAGRAEARAHRAGSLMPERTRPAARFFPAARRREPAGGSSRSSRAKMLPRRTARRPARGCAPRARVAHPRA